ncbi:transmembrane protein 43 homolog isoform X1 [Tribolium madens]|uniref:transmembrane protein 43 homolog isoform X1 n=1 Tax=Tribolium madens TaxID=41895 RepID=UPI001CF73AAA|nr:transmembrane protein 43 homolog isoform X1 [Tribolium madens]
MLHFGHACFVGHVTSNMPSTSSSLIDEFQRSWLTSLIGICILCLGIWLLTWNEGRAVHQAHSLDEAYNRVISLNPYENVRSELDGHLVHITGPLGIDEPLTEPEYGISIQAVKLKRRVQMYQWVEERSPRDYVDNGLDQNYETSDYYYVTEWRDKVVDSSNFYIRHGHHNPTEIPLKSHTYISPFVRVGHLMLGSEIKEKFNDYVEVTSDERPERKDVKLHMGIYYHCDDVWNPEVGDIRVQFYYAGIANEIVTVIAMQKDGVLVPYTTSKGHKIALLRHGDLNINQMFNAEHYDVRLETWKIRAAGVFILYASCVCLARLIKIFFFRIPFLRNIVAGDMTSSTNFAISASVSLLVIATAWILYRPVLGVGLVAAAISPFFYCTMGMYNIAQNQNGFYNR